MDLTLPSDFEQWPEVRGALRARLLSRLAPADPSAFLVLAVWRLWRELGYQASSGRVRVGHLTQSAVGTWLVELPPGPDHEGQPSAKWVLDCFLDPEATGEGLLEPDGDGYFCARFAKLHAHLDPHRLAARAKGNLQSAHSRRLTSLEKGVTQLGLLIDKSKYRLPDGSAASAEQCEGALMLIHNFDSALRRPRRVESDEAFGAQLIQDALALGLAHPPAELADVARAVLEVVETGGHPVIPATTEQLLPKFAALAASDVIRRKREER